MSAGDGNQVKGLANCRAGSNGGADGQEQLSEFYCQADTAPEIPKAANDLSLFLKGTCVNLFPNGTGLALHAQEF